MTKHSTTKKTLDACYIYYGGCAYCPHLKGCKDAYKSYEELDEILKAKEGELVETS